MNDSTEANWTSADEIIAKIVSAYLLDFSELEKSLDSEYLGAQLDVEEDAVASRWFSLSKEAGKSLRPGAQTSQIGKYALSLWQLMEQEWVTLFIVIRQSDNEFKIEFLNRKQSENLRISSTRAKSAIDHLLEML